MVWNSRTSALDKPRGDRRHGGRRVTTASTTLALLIGLASGVAVAVGPPTVLENGRWKLAVVPANPAGETIGDLFGDELGADVYGERWIVFALDNASQQYVDPGLDGTVTQGQGFWIIQIVAPAVTLSASEDVLPASVITSAACAGTSGCAEISLPVSDTSFSWGIVGSPHETTVDTSLVRLTTAATDSACALGCSIAEADGLGLIEGQLSAYAAGSNDYDDLVQTGTLDPWQAAWLKVMPGNTADVGLELLIPRPEGSGMPPPDPGDAGRESLAGLDTDADGVRDDVQVALDAIPYAPPEKRAARQSAMALQSALLVGGGESVLSVQEAGNRLSAAAECLYERFALAAADELAIHEFLVLDTEARVEAARGFDNLSVGRQFSSEEGADACE